MTGRDDDQEAARFRPDIRPGSRADTASSGFTLVEVLVALVLLAVLGATMSAFLGQMRVLAAIQARTTGQAELDAVLRYLETSLSGAMPLPVVAEGTGSRAFLAGTGSQIRFVTIARQGTQSFALRETTLRLRQGNDRHDLIQTFQPRRFAQPDAVDEPLTVVLLENTHGLEFRYLGLDPATGATAWTDRWHRENQLPQAVSVQVVLDRDGRRFSATAHAVLDLASR